MAILKAEVQFNFEGIQELARIYPEMNGRFLALVGNRARTTLKQDFLSGQELTYKSFGTDKKGRPLITSDVNKKRTQTKIYSYPLNLFEKGRTLRDGRKEPGKYIITRKLKQSVMSRMGTYISEFENRILEPEIKKVGL